MLETARSRAHVRPPRSIHVPTAAAVPETRWHVILRLELGSRARIGSDQFVYWNAKDPRRCIAPDAFVKLGAYWVVADLDGARALRLARDARGLDLADPGRARSDPAPGGRTTCGGARSGAPQARG